MITILGPTACGKTTLATQLAATIGAEIISADSRQVYKGMDIGTGKDLKDYHVNGIDIPYHLVDIANAGDKYNVYRFQKDFAKAYTEIRQRKHPVILCGGTGLYIESILRKYRMSDVPQNNELRQQLSDKTLEQLTHILSSYGPMHNKTDVDTAQRAIRAIEIAEFYRSHPIESEQNHSEAEQALSDAREHALVVGLLIDRDLRRKRITNRLKQRLDEGMLDEIKQLLNSGVTPEDLIYYGLEYKYLTLHVIGKISYEEMFNNLEIAIHQFAKRQMTWFRGMERRGIQIHWIDATENTKNQIKQIKDLCTTGSYL